MSTERLPFDEPHLRQKLNHNPSDWDTRLQLADGLYDKEVYAEAAEIIWNGKYVPHNDLDLALAIRILSKSKPHRAIRLLTAVLKLNQGKADHNMAIANAMLHYGMVLQAMRFYGAALEADPDLVNPDIEFLTLWSDDGGTMRKLFEKKISKLGNIPRMIRDPNEKLDLSSRLCLYDMPICLTDLGIVAGEEFNHAAHEEDDEPASVSKSAVPTSLLREKWSGPPAVPGAIPVNPAPVAPTNPSAKPFAPGPRRLQRPDS